MCDYRMLLPSSEGSQLMAYLLPTCVVKRGDDVWVIFFQFHGITAEQHTQTQFFFFFLIYGDILLT